MRVLWFTNTPSLGSKYLNSGNYTGGWIEALEMQLKNLTDIKLAVAFNWPKIIDHFSIEDTKYFPIPFENKQQKIISTYNRLVHQIQSEKHIQKYLDVIHEFKPDIIHIFGTESDYGLIIPYITIPCVIHIQGNIIVYRYKWFSGISMYDLLKFTKKIPLLKGYGLYHDYLINKQIADREKRIFNYCKYFMGRTDWDRRLASVLSVNSKYFHCDELMRPEFFKHQWKPIINSDTFTILTTIRNNIYKGLETIFDCKQLLEEKFPGKKILWKIAGIAKDDELVYIIEKKGRKNFTDLNIQLLGSLKEKELIGELLKSNLFVHPSHIDNSPNSVCEGMLLGMPIIATYAGGIPSLITDKIDGILVQDGDPYALAGAIIELINNEPLSFTLGENARKRATIRHDQNKVVEDLLHCYRTILLNKI